MIYRRSFENSKVEKQMIMISTFGENIEKSRKENIEKQKSFEILQNRLFQKVAMILSCFQHLLLWLKDHCDNDNADR